jgi:hypothetical protein
MNQNDFVCRGIGILPMNGDQSAVCPVNRHRLEADATEQQ